jgi:PAS domain-containing protein
VRHGVGAMRPVPSDRAGGKLMRPPLAVMLAVAICLVLRLAGERAGLANADTGTWLLALSIISLLAGLTWGLAASLGRPELASGAVQAAWPDDRIEKAAFDEAPIGSTLTSLDGRLTRVNRALCEMSGYSAEDLVGMRFSDLTHPHD